MKRRLTPDHIIEWAFALALAGVVVALAIMYIRRALGT